MTLLAKAVVTATLIASAAGAHALGVGDVSDYSARLDASGVTMQTGLQGSADITAIGMPTRAAPVVVVIPAEPVAVVVPADTPVVVMTSEQASAAATPAASSASFAQSAQPLAYGDASGYPYRLGIAPAGTQTAGLAPDDRVPGAGELVLIEQPVELLMVEPVALIEVAPASAAE